MLLATVGVLVTALVTEAAAAFILDTSLLTGMLLLTSSSSFAPSARLQWTRYSARETRAGHPSDTGGFLAVRISGG